MPRRAHPSTTLTTAIAGFVASLFFHLLLWPVGDQMLACEYERAALPVPSRFMEVSLLPDEAEDERAQTPNKESDRIEAPGKLVNLDKVVDQRPPEATDYVSEFDNRVDKETRAPKRRPKPGRVSQPAGDHPKAIPSPKRTKVDPNQNPSKALPWGRQALGEKGDEQGANAGQAARSDDGELSPRKSGSAGNFNPRGNPGVRKTLQNRFGGPGTNDFIDDDVEIGNGNILNSRRWKYASFFNRVRNAVAKHWHPEEVHAANDPQGRIHGTKTRRTKLIISLNPDGSVKRIRIERSSDVDYLDEEAIRAVRSAQPFSNPPQGLVNSSTGQIDFGFAFIFEINGGRRIHRYRQP